MELLPGLDKLNNTWDKIITVILAYAGVLFAIALLILIIHNIVMFMIKQSRWKMLPLLFFYIVAVMDLVIRIYSMIWVIEIYDNNSILAFYYPSVCKLVIGYTQFWTIGELTVRVVQCVNALQSTGLVSV